MKRRHFIEHSALATSMMMISPFDLTSIHKNHIGVQLYSVRDVGLTDIHGTLKKLAAMGYKEVEGYLYENGLFHSHPAAQFRAFLKDLGLKMVSMHHEINLTHWDHARNTLTDQAKKTIDDHAEMGVRLMISPYIEKSIRTPDSLKRLFSIFNHIGEACKNAGFRFGYHNHEFEFEKIGDQYLLDMMMQATEPDLVRLELDLYWVAYAHQEPGSWINKHADRIDAFHVKDMAGTSQRETIEVGEGMIDFKHLLTLPSARKVKYYIVELEHYRTTSMEGVEKSFKNLRSILS
jgi:sugar phosphate isomerase/epimerase